VRHLQPRCSSPEAAAHATALLLHPVLLPLLLLLPPVCRLAAGEYAGDSVAVKLLPIGSVFAEDSRKEACLALCLHHPNIVSVEAAAADEVQDACIRMHVCARHAPAAVKGSINLLLLCMWQVSHTRHTEHSQSLATTELLRLEIA
jgi:hypothetical protein